MIFQKKKGFTQFPDKYETKYADTPPVGYYQADDALDRTRPKSIAAQITEPLNLYKKPASIRPDVNEAWQQPFGASVKNQTMMGEG